MSEKGKVAIFMFFAVLAAAFGEALTSKGMKTTAQPLADAGAWAQIRAAVGSGHVWMGVGLMIVYVFLYAFTLGLTELSFALPLSASSYLIGALLSKYYVGEDVKPARWIGTAVIIAGVLIVAIFGQSSGGGEKGKGEQSGQSKEARP